MNYFLYILKSEVKETYYTGSSDDPEKRCFFHNTQSKGYTLAYHPWKLIYTHGFKTKVEALAAERKVKLLEKQKDDSIADRMEEFNEGLDQSVG